MKKNYTFIVTLIVELLQVDLSTKPNRKGQSTIECWCWFIKSWGISLYIIGLDYGSASDVNNRETCLFVSINDNIKNAKYNHFQL